VAGERISLTAQEQFRARGDEVSTNRPYFQGDVFLDVPMPEFPEARPSGEVVIAFKPTNVILLPHPCGCHSGDQLRPTLTVAPLIEVASTDPISRFDWSGRFDFYPLVDLLDGKSYRAALGEAQSLPSAWLRVEKRLACLSLLGVALLGQKLLKHLARMPEEEDKLMDYYQEVWSDALVWEAWRESRHTAEGYAAWKKADQEIAGLGNVKPETVLASRTGNLIRHLLGEHARDEATAE